ncbi:putative iron-sulfur cluster-binding metallochaperone [Ferrovum sp. PN-J185]|uniref:putative iron-sulfur cluster-binding metallochaperone n=1 Tax=Ferrovum sp. PN-J185 TaxID=1356306 RepID=UPI000792426D|nr:hypothetical protein FV185_09190 [Ferrovum sp. PN-J185]
MSCCTKDQTKNNSTKKIKCPSCDNDSHLVNHKTILYQLKKPWLFDFSDKNFYFCSSSKCSVIYFCEDNTTIGFDELKIQSESMKNTLCFCFNISKLDFQLQPNLKEFVSNQTKKGLCACEINNPSGKCCLKNLKS